jgi:hypothetical protein
MNSNRVMPNLWVGPDPRDVEDFETLKALNVTAVLRQAGWPREASENR